jgi:hypothetical protein
VGRAAGLHHHRRLGKWREELEELVPRQPPAPHYTARSIRHADLEDFLCDVDRNQSIVLHDGLLLPPVPRSDFGTSMPTQSQEESISSMQLTRPVQIAASQLISRVGQTK